MSTKINRYLKNTRLKILYLKYAQPIITDSKKIETEKFFVVKKQGA
jgi:hypothetical protein